MRSRKAIALVPVGDTKRFWHEGRSAQAPALTLFPLFLAPPPPLAELEPDDEQQDRAEIDRQLHQHVARVCERWDHVFTADNSHSPRLVKPTITTSIQYWERTASRTSRYMSTALSCASTRPET